MADITFSCPECSRNLEIDAAGAGLTINCPNCNAELRYSEKEASKVHKIDLDRATKRNPFRHVGGYIAGETPSQSLPPVATDSVVRSMPLTRAASENVPVSPTRGSPAIGQTKTSQSFWDEIDHNLAIDVTGQTRASRFWRTSFLAKPKQQIGLLILVGALIIGGVVFPAFPLLAIDVLLDIYGFLTERLMGIAFVSIGIAIVLTAIMKPAVFNIRKWRLPKTRWAIAVLIGVACIALMIGLAICDQSSSTTESGNVRFSSDADATVNGGLVGAEAGQRARARMGGAQANCSFDNALAIARQAKVPPEYEKAWASGFQYGWDKSMGLGIIHGEPD